MKEELCRAFCNEVSIKEVPAGLAVEAHLFVAAMAMRWLSSSFEGPTLPALFVLRMMAQPFRILRRAGSILKPNSSEGVGRIAYRIWGGNRRGREYYCNQLYERSPRARALLLDFLH